MTMHLKGGKDMDPFTLKSKAKLLFAVASSYEGVNSLLNGSEFSIGWEYMIRPTQ